jgi:hypothetical protein
MPLVWGGGEGGYTRVNFRVLNLSTKGNLNFHDPKK